MANKNSNGMVKRTELTPEIVNAAVGETVNIATGFNSLRDEIMLRRNTLIRQLRTLNAALGFSAGCTDIIEA